MITGNLLILIFVLSLAILFFAILKLKIEPFLALITIAILTALSIGMPLKEVASTVTAGFGNTLAGVGILIGLGVIFGQFLGASGAVEKIAQAVLNVFGIKRSPAGLALTGTAVSIPVFFDAAFVILSGLIRSLATKTGISVVSFVTALGVGLIVSHNMIAPTPGPLVVAENTGGRTWSLYHLWHYRSHSSYVSWRLLIRDVYWKAHQAFRRSRRNRHRKSRFTEKRN